MLDYDNYDNTNTSWDEIYGRNENCSYKVKK